MVRYLNQIEVFTTGRYLALPKEVLSISEMLVYYLDKTIITDGVAKLRIFFSDEPKENCRIDSVENVYAPIHCWEELYTCQDINTKRYIFLLEVISIVESFFSARRWQNNGLEGLVRSINDRNSIFFEVYKQKICKHPEVYKCKVQFKYEALWTLELALYKKDGSVIDIFTLVETKVASSGVKEILRFYASSLEVNDHVICIYWKNKYFWCYNFETKDLSLLSEKALAGDIYGTFELGKILFEGKFVSKDVERAKEWLKKSSDLGNKRAAKLLETLP